MRGGDGIILAFFQWDTLELEKCYDAVLITDNVDGAPAFIMMYRILGSKDDANFFSGTTNMGNLLIRRMSAQVLTIP